jgi:hypothetical protein
VATGGSPELVLARKRGVRLTAISVQWRIVPSIINATS